MRSAAIILAVLLPLTATPMTAQQFGPQPDPVTRTEILSLREAAWRAWFGNDAAAFRRLVPQELVALSLGGGEWEDQEMTIAAMAEFAKKGQKIRSLEFPRNVFQQYGDVVILYTTFRIVLEDKAGKATETTGRGTEVFVRRGGHWIHTGWHLDTVGA